MFIEGVFLSVRKTTLVCFSFVNLKNLNSSSLNSQTRLHSSKKQKKKRSIIPLFEYIVIDHVHFHLIVQYVFPYNKNEYRIIVDLL
jgi:hypothetical protein